MLYNYGTCIKVNYLKNKKNNGTKEAKSKKKLLPRMSNVDLSDSDEERKYITETEDQRLTNKISLLIVHCVMGGYD